jgi:ketosteroid isomerase-like protein
MSRENVEIVRRVYETLNLAERRVARRGDQVLPSPEQIAEMMGELFDPDVEVQQMAGIVGTAGTFRGYDGLLRARAELAEGLVDLEWRPDEPFDELGDRVVVGVRASSTGRASGVRSELQIAHLWELKDGRVVRWVVYPSRAEALEAVGLRE